MKDRSVISTEEQLVKMQYYRIQVANNFWNCNVGIVIDLQVYFIMQYL